MIPYSLQRTTDPSVEPVSVSELKDHLRIDDNSDDGRLANLIILGRKEVERRTGRSLITQTWTLKRDKWPIKEIVLYHPPVASVTSIKYTDDAGAQQTWSSSEYEVDTASEPGLVTLAYGYSYPSTRGDLRNIEVIYVTGYGTAGSDVPYQFRQAVMLAAQLQYDGWSADVQKAYDRIVQNNTVSVYP